ncbi:MAG: hypothetical protein M9916_09195 [Crocinitomicaceae bacterium]|nr:hypothetical protein [Crocinitomicaceae bacterium]
MKRWILFLAVSFIWFSCSDLKKGKQLKQVWLLQNSLDSLENNWNTEELTTIDSISAICQNKIDSISHLYDDQYVSMELAIKLDQYKQCSQGLQELKRVQSFFPSIIKEKVQSLQQLEVDIQTGKGRREKYDEYIEFEKNELITINKQYKRYHFTKKKSLDNYSKSNEDVCDFLSELKASQKLQYAAY